MKLESVSGDERRDFYVYMLLRPGSCVPFYVGKGRARRMHSHMHDERGNSHKANIIRKIKAAGGRVVGIKIEVGLSEAEAFAEEMAWIAWLGRYPNGPLVNKTPGGEGVSGPRSVSERERLIALHTGRKRSEATKAAISAALKGREKSAEHVAAHAASLRGRSLSAENRAAISEALKGRPCPEGTRLALIESNKRRAGRKWSAEERAKQMALRAAKKG